MASWLTRTWKIFEARPETTQQPTNARPRGTVAPTNPVVASSLASMFTAAVNSKKEYFDDLKPLENYYLVDSLLGNIVDDALAPDITSGEILAVTSDDENIAAELRRFQTQFDLDSLVNNITYDLVKNGEYSLRMEVEDGKGVTSITDDLVQESILAFYREGMPYKFLVKKANKIEIKAPYHIAHFILSSRKLRVPTLSDEEIKRLQNRTDPEIVQLLKELPAYARTGRPVLMGVLSKIKELQLLESLIPAVKLADLTAGSIVGVQVPPSADPKEAFNIAREYENLFNKKLSVDDTNKQLTISNILTTAGRVKVIPTYGEKGTLSNIDVRTNSSVNDVMSSIKDTRDVICSAIGYPTELLYGGASKTEMLKKYSRYLKKIKSIQETIADGVRQICLSHLKNVNGTSSATLNDIEIYFKNETVNIDELEKLEYQDAKVGFIRNTITFLNEISGVSSDGEESAGLNLKDIIVEDKLRSWLADQFDFMQYDSNEQMDVKDPALDIRADGEDRPASGAQYINKDEPAEDGRAKVVKTTPGSEEDV